MTNEQKIKAYLAAGHHVKVTVLINNTITIVHDNWWRFVSSNGSLFDYGNLYDKIVEPLPLTPPPYKVWDKVIILDVAKQIINYSEWDQQKKDMIWEVFTIDDVHFCIDIWEYSFPYFAVAPYFDDKEEEKQTKIQELESQLATIAKELELLKK